MKKYLLTLLALLMVNLNAEKLGSISIPALAKTGIKPSKNWNTSLYAGNEIAIMPVLGIVTRDKDMNVEFDFKVGVVPIGVYGIELSCSKLFANKYQDNKSYYMGLGAGAVAGFFQISLMGSGPERCYIALPTAKVFIGMSTENYFFDVGFGVFTALLFEIPLPAVRVGITL